MEDLFGVNIGSVLRSVGRGLVRILPLLHLGSLLFAYLLVAYGGSVPLLRVAFGHALITFAISLVAARDNILFAMRVFFLGIIGLLAISVKLISPDLYFGFHMPESQTLDIAVIMFEATLVGLCGNHFGVSVAKIQPIQNRRGMTVDAIPAKSWQVLGLLSFVLAIVCGQIIAVHMGPVVWSSSTGEHEGDLVINNLNSIANISIYILLMAYLLTRTRVMKYLLLIACTFVFVNAEFLRGARMDVINGLLGLYVIFQIHVHRQVRVIPRHLLILLGAFVVVQVMGILRAGVLASGQASLGLLIDSFNAIVQAENTAGIAFYQGTINDIATTFSGIIYLLQSHLVPFIHGQSYLDFILRTPPEFMFPDRPKDLAWIFNDQGFTSGGGFFELAEAYYNFGLIGCFAVPAIISYLIARAYMRAIVLTRLWDHFVLYAFLAVWMRGILYQTFAFWKGYVTAVILFWFFWVACKPLLKVIPMRAKRQEAMSCVES